MALIEHESERPMEDSQDCVQTRKIINQGLKGAGIVQALDLPESSELCFLNWPGDAVGRILEKTSKSYRVYSKVEELFESLGHDGAPPPIASSGPRDENHADKSNLKARKPIVIFADFFFGAESDRENFLAKFMPMILRNGGLVITRQGWHRSYDLVRPAEHVIDNVDKSIHVEKVLAFPSIENPGFLFRENFLNEKDDAWRVIAEVLDETGKSREPGSSPIPELWERFRIGNDFPTQKAPYFSVFYNTRRFPKSPVNIDFLKISAGERKTQFWIETKKTRGQDRIVRSALCETSSALNYIETACPINFRHTLSSEPYQSGQTLAALWLSALAPDAPPDQLRTYFVDYYRFLKQCVRDSDFNNFDLIPDNLLLDQNGIINPIDQEWVVSDPSFTPEVAFCRGICYFLFRFARRLDMIDSSRQFGPCHRDFLNSALQFVGIDTDQPLESFYRIEQQFREFSLELCSA